MGAPCKVGKSNLSMSCSNLESELPLKSNMMNTKMMKVLLSVKKEQNLASYGGNSELINKSGFLSALPTSTM